jgi:hypothetical protein
MSDDVLETYCRAKPPIAPAAMKEAGVMLGRIWMGPPATRTGGIDSELVRNCVVPSPVVSSWR